MFYMKKELFLFFRVPQQTAKKNKLPSAEFRIKANKILSFLRKKHEKSKKHVYTVYLRNTAKNEKKQYSGIRRNMDYGLHHAKGN